MDTNVSPSPGGGGKSPKVTKRDSKLHSPCRVLVKKMSPEKIKSLTSPKRSPKKDMEVTIIPRYSQSEGGQEELTGIIRIKTVAAPVQKRKSRESSKSEDGASRKQEKRKSKEGKKEKREKNKKSRSREQSVDKSDESPGSQNDLPKLKEMTVTCAPIDAPTTMLFKTKASVKIYDPTQTTSSPMSSESRTPQTPDVRTPQTPDVQTPQTPDLRTSQTPDLGTPQTPSVTNTDIGTPQTPETQSNQPLSVNSSVENHQGTPIQPSPASLPSPTTPLTPSTSGKTCLCLHVAYNPA